VSRPRLLDLFCKAGGAGFGYHLAGFDVVGVDIEPQPRYPFEFIQGDALEALRLMIAGEWQFDAVHASPPCHDHSRTRSATGTNGTGWLLAATREQLETLSVPWVIENVPGATMRPDLKLCGCMFGLPSLRRERWFETSWRAFEMRQACQHPGPAITVTGNGGGNRNSFKLFGRWPTVEDWRRSMGIDWMTGRELSQAIPPAYTEYIGQLLRALEAAA
jgi:DNA (cytosine-5)-methyltransferase 1